MTDGLLPTLTISKEFIPSWITRPAIITVRVGFRLQMATPKFTSGRMEGRYPCYALGCYSH
ncbi:MAG: hypothetical protein JWR69_3799 [Pedosphaera sp.]|nr:hypothetical protein [Pedosphaera sp.]